MRPKLITADRMNRAVLVRQRLVERSRAPIAKVIESVGGLQTQYAPSGYVGLWSRMEGLTRLKLTGALKDGRVIQGTLMRSTIHMVAQRIGMADRTLSRDGQQVNRSTSQQAKPAIPVLFTC